MATTPTGAGRPVSVPVLAALELREVTLVGNDTGGAICQLVATRHPDRLAALVLTNCDAHTNFPPPAFRYLPAVARVPGGLSLLGQSMRVRAVRSLPIAYGWLTTAGVDRERSDRWVEPVRRDAEVRRDVGKVLRGIAPRYTVAAAEELARFGRPILLAWGRLDRFFRPGYAQRLAGEWPDATLRWIEQAATFVPVDAPDELAARIAEFVRSAPTRALE